ncbi:MAG: galactokinase, partial [Lachnospiraceae bacterium]|nr:galactokinase [Lachnospiraceae bacterium]
MKADGLKEFIKNGSMDERLVDIYADKALLDKQKERYTAAVDKFISLYGNREVTVFSAPGRSEVGGNHTDHQHGQVLAAAVNLDVIAIVSATDDGIIKVVSDSFDIAPIDVNDLEKKDEEEGSSEALIRGVAGKIKADGFKVGGFVAYMTSDVLVGAGLSSSAAFEVAVGNVLSGLYNNMDLTDVYIAKVSQYAENHYFGKPCGLMDQMASSVGSLVNIDFYDVNEPVINPVKVEFDKFGHSLCIVDTKGDHADLTPEYAAIPVEMKKVARYFGKDYLKEVPYDDFYDKIPEVRRECGDRAVLRALHFFEDDRRVTDEVNALKAGDFEEFKKLIRESGDSSYKYLQNVYPVCDLDNQNVAVALALTEHILKDKAGYRVHGGGFAGTIQAFVPNDLVDDYKRGIEKYFGEGSCHVLKVRKYGG